MNETFSDEADFQAAIEARLGALVQADLAGPLGRGIVEGEAAWRADPAPTGATALNLRLGRFFIRDDDLPVIETIGTVASALAATGASGGLAIPALIPAITGLAALAWNLWRKGVLLGSDELTAIGVLRQQGPCSVEDLLPLVRAAGVQVADKDAMERMLRRLGEVETRDGTVVKLAKKEDGGLWRPHAV
jgi:hypothetical protein